MIYLIGSIVLTSYLTLAFKACEKLKIAIFPTIIFNYITCVITGSLVNGAFPITATTVQTDWFKWAMVMGVLFISIFNVVGITAQKIGVAVASVANKLSLVIPVILSVYLYHETVAGWKLVGVLVAIIAVIFTCMPSVTNDSSSRPIPMQLKIGLPLVLFIGSGLLDALINHVQQQYVTPENNNAYLISGFFSAACIGTTVLLFQFITGKRTFISKELIAGICIGIPNYFSIWCLVKFLQISPLESSASFPINNMGIVLFSTLVAWIIFKEKLSAINWIGVLLSLIAIFLIAFGNQLL